MHEILLFYYSSVTRIPSETLQNYSLAGSPFRKYQSEGRLSSILEEKIRRASIKKQNERAIKIHHCSVAVVVTRHLPNILRRSQYFNNILNIHTKMVNIVYHNCSNVALVLACYLLNVILTQIAVLFQTNRGRQRKYAVVALQRQHYDICGI